ncbi:acetyltransferase [Colletotrichum tofieldiae]|nr:acetyltransferase [Colletotrichum tofieldiae]
MTVSAPKQPLSFRPATPADIASLLPLIRAAYRGALSGKGWTTEADLVADKRISEAGLLAKIAEPEGSSSSPRTPPPPRRRWRAARSRAARRTPRWRTLGSSP